MGSVESIACFRRVAGHYCLRSWPTRHARGSFAPSESLQMSFRRSKTAARESRAYRDFVQANSALFQASGLPISLYESRELFDDLLMHGYIDHHPDPTHFNVGQLSGGAACGAGGSRGSVFAVRLPRPRHRRVHGRTHAGRGVPAGPARRGTRMKVFPVQRKIDCNLRLMQPHSACLIRVVAFTRPRRFAAIDRHGERRDVSPPVVWQVLHRRADTAPFAGNRFRRCTGR